MATGLVLHHRPQGHHMGGATCFSLGSPPRLASWVNEGLIWGPPKDVPLLQGRIRYLLERDINLTVVAQVMVICRTLPCKRRPLRLWEFNPEGP